MNMKYKGDGKMATWDRIVRIIVGTVLVYVTVFSALLPASWYPYAYILTVIGVLNIIFPITGWCPLYAGIGFSTCNIKNRKGD